MGIYKPNAVETMSTKITKMLQIWRRILSQEMQPFSVHISQLLLPSSSQYTDMITAWNKEVWTASEGKYTKEHWKCWNNKARGLVMMDKNKQGLVKGWVTLVEMPAVATASAVTWEAGGGQRWYYGDITAPWAAFRHSLWWDTHTHLKAPAIPDRKRGTIVSCLSSLTATMPDNGFILISKMGPVL